MTEKPQYYFEDVYRKIKDYGFCYKTWVKRRWIGKKILDMFVDEFKAFTPEYYKEAITEGRIVVNKNKVDIDHVLKDNECIEHTTIRKEPPVLNVPIEIVSENDYFLVVCKPSSMPVHVCGNYMYNTVLAIMKNEMGYEQIYSLHRLDKLTSGLLLLSKSQELATKFQKDLVNHQVEKMYIARVTGKFPDEEVIVDKPIYCACKKAGKYDCCENDEKEIKEKEAKEAKTKFKKRWYDEVTNTSLIECRPITGRTHQIRVHLRSFGHSIINDRNYGGLFIGNKIVELLQAGKPVYTSEDPDGLLNVDPEEEEKLAEKEASDPGLTKKVKKDEGDTPKNLAIGSVNNEESKPETDLKEEKEKVIAQAKDTSNLEETKEKPDEKVEEKNGPSAEGDDKDQADEEGGQSYCQEIWLHSLVYKYKGMIFKAKLPYWALQTYKF